MSRSVLDFLITLIRAGPARGIAQRIGVLSQWGQRFHWKTLARKVRLERPDPHVWFREWSMRTVMAFILSYVLVVTVGMTPRSLLSSVTRPSTIARQISIRSPRQGYKI